MTIREVVVYQTGDGKTFLCEEGAKEHIAYGVMKKKLVEDHFQGPELIVAWIHKNRQTVLEAFNYADQLESERLEKLPINE